eukprot:CAMPEP_0170515512 /NCGR_PEP_ID=MMETSP0209-20121228/1937_1 /TAXON_ID=665100 ORGANISM="Litonotus pictus, Strain P1" /NCGR_SAMPLE_ID=MMETSP0209 /ASSEMBLY_ACC=CAM_ASM_000301 /LENGTH=314 /DNA_ID=CAMNT_0010800035 /DNA_START=8 /DNA_END=952 /DNA_ORIENTATION=+
MTTSFNDLIEFLKLDCDKDSDKKPKQFKEILELIRKNLHDKVDLAKDNLMDYGVRAFELQEKKIKEGMVSQEQEESSGKSVKAKIQDLVGTLDSMLNRTEFIEKAIKIINEEQTNKLIENKKGDLEFKLINKFKFQLEGKSTVEIGWKEVQNKTQNSSLDKNNKSILNIHSNSCYNYYVTDKDFVDENVELVFLTTCHQVSGYFYFGVVGDGVNVNSNCMCCSISGATYFMSGGNVVEAGNKITEQKLNNKNNSKQEYRVRIQLRPSEKQVFFEVEDKGECGPYKLPDSSKYTIVSGSCNSCNGYIKIDYAQYV